MKRITINVGTHGVETTASEMRKRLAQVLSKIPGDQIVFFNLTLHLEDYKPPFDHLHQENEFGVCRICAQRQVATTAVLGELARPEND